MIMKRIVGKQNSINLTFRMFRHTSSEVAVQNRGKNYIFKFKLSNQLKITMIEALKKKLHIKVQINTKIKFLAANVISFGVNCVF